MVSSPLSSALPASQPVRTSDRLSSFSSDGENTPQMERLEAVKPKAVTPAASMRDLMKDLDIAHSSHVAVQTPSTARRRSTISDNSRNGSPLTPTPASSPHGTPAWPRRRPSFTDVFNRMHGADSLEQYQAKWIEASHLESSTQTAKPVFLRAQSFIADAPKPCPAYRRAHSLDDARIGLSILDDLDEMEELDSLINELGESCPPLLDRPKVTSSSLIKPGRYQRRNSAGAASLP